MVFRRNNLIDKKIILSIESKTVDHLIHEINIARAVGTGPDYIRRMDVHSTMEIFE
jgi:hypothetical protein